MDQIQLISLKTSFEVYERALKFILHKKHNQEKMNHFQLISPKALFIVDNRLFFCILQCSTSIVRNELFSVNIAKNIIYKE